MIGRELRAFVGLVFEVAQILILRKWEDDEPDHHDEQGDAGDGDLVVRVPPSATSMVARASTTPRPYLPAEEPLEGSIEARRMPSPSR